MGSYNVYIYTSIALWCMITIRVTIVMLLILLIVLFIFLLFVSCCLPLKNEGQIFFLLNILKCQCGHVIRNHWPNPLDAIVYRFRQIIYKGAWVWNLERSDWSLMKVPRFFYRVFSVPKKRGHRLFWNLSRPYYCILLKKAIQGNEPTLPPPPTKIPCSCHLCFGGTTKNPWEKSCTFFYNSPKIWTMERDEESKNLFTDCPVRNPLSKTSREKQPRYPETCWTHGKNRVNSMAGWRGSVGTVEFWSSTHYTLATRRVCTCDARDGSLGSNDFFR